MRIKLLLEFVESYDYKLIKDSDSVIQYMFNDIKNNKYLVDFTFHSDNLKESRDPNDLKYELTYRVFNKSLNRYDLGTLTGVNPWKVISTVFGDILNDFIGNHPDVGEIYIYGMPKENQSDFEETTRSKLYKRFLNRNCPEGWYLELYRNEIYLIRQ